ncbi:MAG TPA: hypothetical protein VLX92_21730 [Kofleriaceae bacterium]|nr:hypothetical protein [Kofleriaceae bacterium]
MQASALPVHHHNRPATRSQRHELRDLLEANLAALHALHEEQQRSLAQSLRAIEGMRGELRAELRALGDSRAPWVRALEETRALLYVALRELIVGEEREPTRT